MPTSLFNQVNKNKKRIFFTLFQCIQLEVENIETNMKRCYYEILAVEKKATTSEIKSAYRKMAMKYHPDKNPSEEGKKIFLEVQEAYDVLCDPNERTFYDNNRQKILFNKDQMSKEDLEQFSFGFNIWEYFTVRCFKGYNDEEGSFCNVYREVFEKIKAEQAKAFKSRDDLEEDMRKYEGFGASNTNIDKVLGFYNDWQNFTTYKTFSWSEQYDTRDAENRWVKRRMQEQNKKERIKEKKNYIKTIKDLVNFVKKRDLRFQQHLAQVREEQERKEKQKIKKQEEKKKQKQDMKKVKQILQEERFRQIEEYYKQNNAPEEKHHVCDDDEDIPQFYCPICQKSFKSENQLLNHEKSKIHKQNVKLLQKEVMLPGQKVEEDEEQQAPQNVPEQSKKKRNRKKKNKNANTPAENQQKKDEQEQKPQKKPENINSKKTNEQKKKVESEQSEQDAKKNKNANKNQKKQQPKPTKKQSQSEESSDDDVFMQLVKNKTNKTNQNEEQQAVKKDNNKKNQKQKQKAPQVKPVQKSILNMVESSEQEAGGDEKKMGKAKLKKMKKAQQQKDTGLKCKTCSVVFPSKTKLFDHIKQSGHAAFKS